MVKWLQTNGVEMDVASMDNLFATFNPGGHYFTLQCCKADMMIIICDALATSTNKAHKLATVLQWAILIASARAKK
jgi:hypothetical protein